MEKIETLMILISFIIAALIVVCAWFVINKLSWKRKINQQTKDLRLRYLIEAFQNLKTMEAEGITSYKGFLAFRQLANNISLFGSKEQVDIMDSIMSGAYDKMNVNKLERLLLGEIREAHNQPFDPEKTGVSLHWNGVDETDKYTELKFNSMLKCYKYLLKLNGVGIHNIKEFKELYEILQEIWIFGDVEQSNLATLFAEELQNKAKETSLVKLLFSIYKPLRAKLNLPAIENYCGSIMVYDKK